MTVRLKTILTWIDGKKSHHQAKMKEKKILLWLSVDARVLESVPVGIF